MLNTPSFREIYAEIQNQLFYLIPEKWSKIYLYASVINKLKNLESGEMFFYYFPKGVLKKNPVNVYEVPSKFNVNEKEYLVMVDKLYDTIKKLRKEFRRNKQELWSNLTIIIENNRFTIKYSYQDLLGSKYSSYDRHIIWKYEYLDMPIEIVSRKDRKMLENYYAERENKIIKVREYSEGMYNNRMHNVIKYDKQSATIEIEEKPIKRTKKVKNSEKEIVQNAKNNISIIDTRMIDKYEEHKQERVKVKVKERKVEEHIEENVMKGRNQILNFQ